MTGSERLLQLENQVTTLTKERDDAVQRANAAEAAQKTLQGEMDTARTAVTNANTERDNAVKAQKDAEKERDDAKSAQAAAEKERDEAKVRETKAREHTARFGGHPAPEKLDGGTGESTGNKPATQGLKGLARAKAAHKAECEGNPAYAIGKR